MVVSIVLDSQSGGLYCRGLTEWWSLLSWTHSVVVSIVVDSQCGGL